MQASSAGENRQERPDVGLRRSLLVRSVLMMTLAGLIWAPVYLLLGELRAATVAGVGGDGHLEMVRVGSRHGAEEQLRADAMFVFIGASPRTEWLGATIARDARGFLLTGRELLAAKRWGLDRDPYRL